MIHKLVFNNKHVILVDFSDVIDKKFIVRDGKLTLSFKVRRPAFLTNEYLNKLRHNRYLGIDSSYNTKIVNVDEHYITLQTNNFEFPDLKLRKWGETDEH